MQIFIASLDPSHSRARLPAPVRAGLLLVMAVLVLASAAAEARVRWVGDSSNCEYHTIAQAISAAGSSSGPDEVRITKDHPFNEWHGQALVINNQEITIGGNWDYCGQPDAEYTVGYGVVSGFGGEAAPVFRIRGTSHVNFYGLTITLGDPSITRSYGGGIDFVGEGSLYLSTVILQYNVSLYGGAIKIACADSDGRFCPSGQTAVTLTLGDNVYIYDNSAKSGGGVFLGYRSKLIMKDAYTFFHRNHAEFGGAIYFQSGAIADIGSPQPAGTAGVFFQNSASVSGGAIYVGLVDGLASDRPEPINLYSVSATEPLSFVENQAPIGAAVAVDSSAPNAERAVCATHVYMHGNQPTLTTSNSSTIDVRGHGASYSVNSDDCLFQVPQDGRIDCGPLDQSQCDLYSANIGTIFAADSGGQIFLRRVRLNQNAGDQLFDALAGDVNQASAISVLDSIIDHNAVNLNIGNARANAWIAATNVTIADNQLAANGAVFTNADNGQIVLRDSIIDDPTRFFLGVVGGTNFMGLLVQNAGSVSLPAGNVVGRPSYIPGFYRLQPYSEGIDRVMVTAGLTDPDGTPRSIDNVDVNHTVGFFADIGAYESTATSIPPELDTIFASSFE